MATIIFSLCNSKPTPILPYLAVVIADVKLLAKGSNKVSPINENVLTAYSGISSGKGAVCPSVFLPCELILITEFINFIKIINVIN